MADVVVYSEGGRTYRITGLETKAQEILGAGREMDGLIADRVEAANQALAEWRGPHASTFAEGANEVLMKMASLRVALLHAGNVLAAFPEAPAGGLGTAHYVDSIYLDARVEVPEGRGTASARPADLRAYATTASGQDGRFAGLAGVVNLDGVTAEVTYDRGLTSAERQEQIDAGVPRHEADTATVSETDPVSDVASLIPLPSPEGEVGPLAATSEANAELALAVAIAFENADQRLLDLLASYPDLAGFIVEGMGDGRVSGESSLAIVMAWFSSFDTAADGGDPDGRVSRDDLEAALDDGSLPEHVRAAARYLLDNPVLFGLAETVDQEGRVRGTYGDGLLSTGDIETFLAFNATLRTVEQNFGDFDTAADGGEGDGVVSLDDLEALAAGSGPTAEAARWLLDHPTQRHRLGLYEVGQGLYPGSVPYEAPTFSRESLIGLVVDQQAYGDDPEAAHSFVLRLPVAEGGEEGLPLTLCSDEGVKALANTALVDTRADLSETHAVIAHLPETTGAVRNQLITGFYAELGQRADALFAGDLAGQPAADGHPGANWLLYAPWASNGVHDVISGDFSVLGITPGLTDRQAAADGNQWIFDDIGARYAAFVEMYESNPNPTEAELESFFASNFQDGDAHIRNGFSAYVAAMEETDPVRRQHMLFQGNTLVAMHEQAGVQPYLEEISTGPDGLVVEYIDLSVGSGDPIDVNHDVPSTGLRNNHVDDAAILGLDPVGKGPDDFVAAVPGATEMGVGDRPRPGVVDMRPMPGIESWDDEFPTSTRTWWEEGGTVTEVIPVGEHVVTDEVLPPADGAEGSAAGSWTDRSERMWFILKLFEQNHTNPQLYETGRRGLELEDVDWLHQATGLR